MSTTDKPLKMVTCPGCEAKVFIPGDLPPLATEPCKRCGHPIMMPMQLRQFELRSKIASGGHGKVYRAWDTVLERMVAIKLMRKELENDPAALESFYREARACASLNHTNIIHIYAFDEFEGQRYLVMELADRGSLDTRIEKQQRLHELDVLDIGIKIASALDLALKHNLLHRDIKPGNILFNADNEPKLVDFGLARSAEAEPESATVTEGTPYYVAPEKIKREKETFLSDMYSLGCTLVSCADRAMCRSRRPPLRNWWPRMCTLRSRRPTWWCRRSPSPPVMRWSKCWPRIPADRFLSYDEFRMAFELARSQYLIQQSQSTTDSSGKSKTSWWRR